MILGNVEYGNDSYRNGKFRKKNNKNIVFFNSNQYLGHGDASHNTILRSKTGESKDDFQKQVFNMYSSAVQQDINIVIQAAEKRLLNTLIFFSSAREAMKVAVSTNLKNLGNEGDNKFLEWSTNGRFCYEKIGWRYLSKQKLC